MNKHYSEDYAFYQFRQFLVRYHELPGRTVIQPRNNLRGILAVLPGNLLRAILKNMKSTTFPERIIISDHEIDLSRMSDQEKEFALHVADDTIIHYERFGKPRALFGIAGPSGAGKSLLAAIVVEIARRRKLSFRIETVSIDAFHFPHEYLAMHESGGVNLKDMKGRYDTYDTQLLASELTHFRGGAPVRFPVYSRTIHEPVPGMIHIAESNVLLLLEGLWILYDHAGWGFVHNELDYAYFLDDELARLRKHTVERHIRGGRGEKDAEHFYEKSDMKNYRLVMQTKKHADQFLSWPKEIGK